MAPEVARAGARREINGLSPERWKRVCSEPSRPLVTEPEPWLRHTPIRTVWVKSCAGFRSQAERCAPKRDIPHQSESLGQRETVSCG
jgi:hypothetical protein